MTCGRANEVDLAAFAVDRKATEWAEFRDHYPRCSPCSEAVAAFSDLTTLLASGAAGLEAGHPEPELLLDYQVARSSLSAGRLAWLEAHLIACGGCRGELSLLRSFDFGALPFRAVAPVLAAEASAPGLLSRLAGLLAMQPRWLTATAVVMLLYAGSTLVVRDAGEPGATPPRVEHSARAPAPAAAPTPGGVAEPPAATPAERLAQSGPALADAPEPAPIEPSIRGASEETLASARVALSSHPTFEPLPLDSTSLALELPEAVPAPGTEVAAALAPVRRSAQPTPQSSSQPEPPPAFELDAPDEILLLAANLPLAAPDYHPGAIGGLEDLRSQTSLRGDASDLPAVRALAPEHAGAAAGPSPTLYWYLSKPSPVRVELSLMAEDAIDPALEIVLEPPVPAGIHALSLADHGVGLVAGVLYRWHVSLVPDRERRELDSVASAALRYAPLSAAASALLEGAGAAERAHEQAALGYWYDAFATLSVWAEASPELARLDAHRAALLEQVGLDEVAAALRSPRGE